MTQWYNLSQTYNPQTGQWENKPYGGGGSGGGVGGGGGGTNPVTTPTTPTTPAWTPPQPTSGIFANLNQAGSDYFNDPNNYTDTEDQYFRSIGLTGNALEYAKRQAASIRSAFAQTSFQDPSHAPLFTTWLSGGGSQQLINGYNMMSARNRGANPGAFTTGRMIF